MIDARARALEGLQPVRRPVPVRAELLRVRRVAVVIRPLYSAWSAPASSLPIADLRAMLDDLARRQYAADLLARMRWAVAVEWQILAHSVRNCTSAADARYAIERRAQLD